jgi:uncharacterized protein (TIGR03382 family)
VEIEVQAGGAPVLHLALDGDAVRAVASGLVLSVESPEGQATRVDVVAVNEVGELSAPLRVDAVGQAKTWQEGAGCGGPFGCAAAPGAGEAGALAVMMMGAVMARRRTHRARR